MRDMGTSAESAQQQQNLTPNSTPPEDRATSPLSSMTSFGGDRTDRGDRSDRDDRSEGKDRNDRNDGKYSKDEIGGKERYDSRDRSIGMDSREGSKDASYSRKVSVTNSIDGKDSKYVKERKDGIERKNSKERREGKDRKEGRDKDDREGKEGGRESPKKSVRLQGSTDTIHQSKDADYDSDGSYKNSSEYKRALVLRMLSSRAISSPNVRLELVGLGSYSQERGIEMSPNSRSCEG